MSKQSTSAIPGAPQPSRRALLMGLAVAATPMAPALANALSEAVPAAADPIFDLIEKHTEACAEVRRLSDTNGDLSPKDPEHDKIAAQEKAAHHQEEEAIDALLSCPPTTLAGVLAVLEHVGQMEWIFGDNSGEAILTGAHESGAEEANAFPAHLAAALRSLIGNTQAPSGTVDGLALPR
jgi:hypothetical protein